MRKIICVTLVLISVFCMPAFSAQDQEDEKLVPQKEPAAKNQQNLVDMGSENQGNQIRDLEREVQDLRRDLRFQEDQIRNLERTVNDLRRLRP